MPRKIKSSLLLLITVTCFVASCAFAKGASAPQIEWQQYYTGTVGYSILQTDDGGFALVGTNASVAVLVKTDSSGNLIWSKEYRLGAETNLPYLAATEDGGYGLAGTLNNTFLLVKTDASGNLMWNRTFSYDAPFNSLRAFTSSDDGGFLLAGTVSPPQNASHAIGQLLLLKTDASGDLQWNRTITGPQGDFANTVVQTDDGGYAIFDTSWASDELPSEFKIIKIDALGNEQWNQTYGGSGKFYTAESDTGIFTADGGYMLAGVSVEKGSDWLAWIVKTDGHGNMEWNQNYGGFGSWALAVVQSQEGGYAFAGLYNREDVWLAKIDSNGGLEWDMKFPGATIWGVSIEDFGKCLIQPQDGGYILVGSQNGQIWLAKIVAHPAVPLSIPAVIAFVIVFVLVATVIFLLMRRRKSSVKQ